MTISLFVNIQYALYADGDLERNIHISIQIRDKDFNLLALRSFSDVTLAQAKRAMILQRKLAGRK